ncbi:MAG: ABC transporter permease [Nanoarchaeota archaeon]|nr:ABC transporter permease [Nanoarchaeota archaeon]
MAGGLLRRELVRMIQDYFKLALKNLGKRKLRSWLTVIGIIISVAIIFVLISLSVGLSDAINEQFQMLGSDKFFIMPKGQMGAPGTGGAVELTTEDVDIIEKVGGVGDVSEIVAGNGKIEFNKETRYFFVVGIPIEDMGLYTESTSLTIIDGRNLKQEGKREVLLGWDYEFGNVFEKPVRPGNSFLINDEEFKVVGIMSRVGNPQDDKNVIIPYEDFRELFNSGDRIDQIVVQVQEGQDINEVADAVKRRLMKFRDVDEKTIDFTISTPEELLASFSIILNIITGFLVGVAGISLLVGGIGIANTMYTSVLERTKEIGTMKAVGAKNSDILLIFLIESGLLGLIGGIIGLGLGFGVAKIVEFIAVNQLGTTLLKAAAPLWLSLGVLGFGFLIGAVSGVAPAYQASKLKTVDALRYE